MRQTFRDFYDSAREMISTCFGRYGLAYAGIDSERAMQRQNPSYLDNTLFFGDQMSRRELVSLIKRNGGRLVRSSKHEIYEVNGRTAAVPHGSGGKEIPGGTVKNILRALGINRVD